MWYWRFVVVLVSIVAMAVPALAVPTGNGPFGTEFSCTPAQTRYWASRLKAERPGEWREAGQRLAWAGREGLQVVDSIAGLGDGIRPERIKAYLQLALLASVTPEQLEEYPRLHSIVDGEIEEGLAIARTQVMDTVVSGPKAIPTPQQLALGGFAVPGALLLCREPRPGARAHGVLTLRYLGAVAQVPHMDSMRVDPGQFRISRQCFFEGSI